MTPEPCRVFILAGGLGTRLRAMFPDQPKAMVPIAGRPFLEHQVTLLARQSFRDIVFCVGYRSQQIAEYFGDGAGWGVRISYCLEPQPLGTAGALKHAAEFWSGSVLVLNGDTYLDTDYQALVAQHRGRAAQGAIGTVGLMHVADCSRYGQVLLAPDGRIRRFEEKKEAPAGAGLVNAGVYVLEPGILEAIPAGRAVSMEYETFPALQESSAGLYGVALDGKIIDIGTPEGYTALEQYLNRQPSAPRR
jgi:NDP-sugar pyrophosphorylase family protein